MSGQLNVQQSLAFRKKLKGISDDLTSGEVYQLKCLVSEHIPAGEREHIRTALALFASLEKRRLLANGDEDFLILLLQKIGRKDIINKQNLKFSGKGSLEKRHKEMIENSFTSLLHVVSEQLVSAELEALKELLVDTIPRGKLQHITTSFSLFNEMESHDLLSKSYSTILKDLLETVGRKDLVKVITNFEEKGVVVKPSGRGGQVEMQLRVASTRVPAYQKNAMEETGPEIVIRPKQATEDSTVGLLVFGSSSGDVLSQEQPKKKLFQSEEPQCPEPMDVTESMVENSVNFQSTRRDHGTLPGSVQQPHSLDTELGQTRGYLSCLQSQQNDERGYQSSGPSAPSMNQLPHQAEAVSNARLLEQQQLVEAEKNSMMTELRRVQQHLEQANQAMAEQQRRQATVQQHLERERTKREDLETERRRMQEEVSLLKAKEQQLLQQAQQPTGPTRPTGPSVDLECYSMTKNPRGYALIISIERFPNSRANLSDRQGSEKDVQKLSRTFEKLKFRIDVRHNLTGSQLVAALREYGSRDHSNYDCFVCCMLSHGKKDFIYGSDSDLVNIEQLTGQVNGLSCPSLQRKPKLFFVQACRGEGDDRGVETDAGLDTRTQRDAIEQVKIPLGADYLLGYASPPGKVSFRSTTQGSWYITALCEILDIYAERGMSLTDMLIKVNQRLAEATTSDGFKQIPSPINQLTKRLVFTSVGQ